MTLRKTKIVATLGPSSSSEEMLARMITAGVNVVRLNFSHGTAEEHIKRAEIVRSIAAKLGRPVGVLCDLQGPKIRIGKFELGKVALKMGDIFILDADCELGNQDHVGLDYKALPQEVSAGDVLLLDDGRITMQVDRVKGNQIHCLVLNGGVLSNNKGINRQGGGLSADALTKKDREDIKTAVKLEADYIAMSFPKNALDVELARTLVKKAGGNSSIIAKIERAEAIENLEAIIEASDAIMVARGDLGVEVGDAAVPGLQKRMIRMAVSYTHLDVYKRQQKYAPHHQRDVQCYDDLESLIQDADVQAIYCPMANEEHAEWAIKAIKAGKHVLIEKPMAIRLQAINAIYAAANQYQVKVMEGFMYRFHPQHQQVQDIVASGLIGDVLSVRASYSFLMKASRMYRINRNMACLLYTSRCV